MTADKLLTVSPHYAKEIASNVAKGVELDNVIRYTPVSGSMQVKPQCLTENKQAIHLHNLALHCQCPLQRA